MLMRGAEGAGGTPTREVGDEKRRGRASGMTCPLGRRRGGAMIGKWVWPCHSAGMGVYIELGSWYIIINA